MPKSLTVFKLLFIVFLATPSPALRAEEDLSVQSEWKDNSGLTIVTPSLDLGVLKLPSFNQARSYFSKARLVTFANYGTEYIGVELNCSARLGEWTAPKGRDSVDAVGYLWVPKTRLTCTPDSFLMAPGQETVVKMELEGVYPNVHSGYYDIYGRAAVSLNGSPIRDLELKGRVLLAEGKRRPFSPAPAASAVSH